MTQDPAAEYLRLAERYRQMSDEELLELIPESESLTHEAQQALASEIRSRGLRIETSSEESTAKPTLGGPKFRQESPEAADDSPESDTYEEERKLVELCTVWSQRDALKLQCILDVAGIPFFMGPEKATGVDKVTSNFANSVSVQIMQVGMPWAGPLMKNYEPEDDPAPPDNKIKEARVRCPKCNSTEVVFDRLIAAAGAPADTPSQKFEWTCDACGATWQDDGVAKEV